MKHKNLVVNVFLLAVVLAAAAISYGKTGFQKAETLSINDITSAAPSTPAPDRVALFLSQREKTREKEAASLKTLLDSASADQALKESAQQQLLMAAQNAEAELSIEAALAGMRLTGVASVTHQTAYVYILEKLNQEQAALLFSAVAEITGLPDEQIRISDGNQIV